MAASGLTKIYTGAAADAVFESAQRGDSHAPDVVGIARYGVVYTGGVKKIAEHGGNSTDDRAVALVVSGAGTPADRIVPHDRCTRRRSHPPSCGYSG